MMKENNLSIKDCKELKGLLAFDCLEVGPVKLKKESITIPYTVVNKNSRETIELIYSYEEDVFDPADESYINLAGMIGAQVALNYGLFCKKILFIGMFDNIDRVALKDWAENTAKEIYVKKFLEPNPFLTDKFQNMQAIKLKSYLRAELEFQESDQEPVKTKWEFWNTDRQKHCVLSSGGKDSLLTYGLINELGFETHPYFVNESGRHWFTAINSYKYFKENVKGTGRVWTNSDRVFSWMLKHLPFIKTNYASIRADIYPVRLWTVAVFLFGVLPLMRKHGIGRLLIGDEYDTSTKVTHKSIPHFDGLYDQSRYFDDQMSRFFMRKGWAISQFSVLRQLSEMLIETILAKRYPYLLENQVSCHAAHKEDERIKPCGKCEKCRRIVGMLTAIDVDPKHCGYTDDQIKICLTEISKHHVHQEAAGSEHLLILLHKKGLVNLDEAKLKKIKEHPEILQVRFDQERSPMIGIPEELRKPLYKIFMEYSNGAVRRVSRSWNEIDPFKDPSFKRPYPFEFNKEQKPAKRQSKLLASKYMWSELTWQEAEARLKTVDVALLPVGAIEQHGPHLPLDVDAYDADYLAKKVAEACSDPKPFVLPLLSYGVSYHHDDFQGTISISNSTLAQLVYEIGMNIARQGINKLVIINGHGDNSPTLNYAAQLINRDAKIFVAVDTGETSDVDLEDLSDTPNDVHAGEIETSTTLAIRPDMVQMDKARKTILSFSSRYMNFSSIRNVPWYAQTKKISDSGTMGDPTKANPAKGKKMWEIMIAHLVAFVEDLKDLTLKEIHQKKY
jgi:creatinine amidohydrolase/Fe(II)-dependent formamide hydrolase-like protein